MERRVYCNTQDEKWVITNALRGLGVYFEAMGCGNGVLVIFSASDKEFKSFQEAIA